MKQLLVFLLALEDIGSHFISDNPWKFVKFPWIFFFFTCLFILMGGSCSRIQNNAPVRVRTRTSLSEIIVLVWSYQVLLNSFKQSQRMTKKIRRMFLLQSFQLCSPCKRTGIIAPQHFTQPSVFYLSQMQTSARVIPILRTALTRERR